jgi:hypothetical protein
MGITVSFSQNLLKRVFDWRHRLIGDDDEMTNWNLETVLLLPVVDGYAINIFEICCFYIVLWLLIYWNIFIRSRCKDFFLNKKKRNGSNIINESRIHYYYYYYYLEIVIQCCMHGKKKQMRAQLATGS